MLAGLFGWLPLPTWVQSVVLSCVRPVPEWLCGLRWERAAAAFCDFPDLAFIDWRRSRSGAALCYRAAQQLAAICPGVGGWGRPSQVTVKPDAMFMDWPCY